MDKDLEKLLWEDLLSGHREVGYYGKKGMGLGCGGVILEWASKRWCGRILDPRKARHSVSGESGRQGCRFP